MAAIGLVGSPPIPVRYDSWDAWRAEVSHPLAPAPLVAAGTSSCPACWGQGRILEPARNGEGLVPHPCERCDGGGLVLTEPAA